MGANSSRAGILAGLIFAVSLLSVERATALDLSDVLPELRVIPAPPSVREGMRLTYYVAVATVAQTFAEEWVDEAGKTNTLHTPTPSGHGYTQVDVIAVSPGYAALRVQPWLFYNFNGPPVPQFGADESLVCYAGGGDWYAHPDVLAKVSQILTPELKILRMPLKVGDRVYDALRVQAEDAKSRQVLSYDLQTGYLFVQRKRRARRGNDDLVAGLFRRRARSADPVAGRTLAGLGGHYGSVEVRRHLHCRRSGVEPIYTASVCLLGD
ncbi:MAG: hypothetical protein AB9869_32330 [Verrucomicrobiia bacterium]